MVIGLDRFKQHFYLYNDQYILIGGTACSVIMQDSGLNFRATKDFDVVLHVEGLNQNFVNAFWEFIEQGGYSNKHKSTSKDIFYRFSSPIQPDYPAMIELFSRVPDNVNLSTREQLTPIPIDESVASLSAILLDEDYYHFIHSGKETIYDLPILKATHLIPIKARAYLDLKHRKSVGEKISSRDIRKHKNDVFRLFQILPADSRIKLPNSIKKDFADFILNVNNDDNSLDLRNLELKSVNFEEMIKVLSRIYEI